MRSALRATPFSLSGQRRPPYVQDGPYLIVRDLDSQTHKSKLTVSEINTLCTKTFLIGQHAATNENHTFHTFAHYDGIFVI